MKENSIKDLINKLEEESKSWDMSNCCESFPNLVCNETIGLDFEDWCEICKQKYLTEQM